MRKYKHCYCIPTNREVAETVSSYLTEIEDAISSNLISQQEILLTIIDDGDEYLSMKNQAAVSELLQGHNIDWLYIPNECKGLFIQRCCGENTNLLEIFTKTATNYGNIATISSLVAHAVGAEYLHRRDSDTLLHIEEDGRMLSPLEAELTVLKENSDCAVVGSNYFCNNDVDVRIFSDSPELERELYFMLGNTEESLTEKMNLSPKASWSELKWAPIPEEGMWPDMGNITFGPLYRELPFPPHGNTLGTDYFLTAVASFRGDSLYLHNQRVLHQYKENRSTTPYYKDYFCSLAKYVDYNEYYYPLFENIGSAESTKESMIESLSEMVPEQSREERREVLTKYAGIFERLKSEQGKIIAETVTASIENILAHTEEGAKNHLLILQYWDHMKQRAETFQQFDFRTGA